MSASGIAILFSNDSLALEPKSKHPLLVLYERYTPSQGWSTFVFLVLALLIVGNSVTSAEWTETPRLLSLMVWGAIAGLLLAKVRVNAIPLHLTALILGFVVVVWQASSLIEDESLVGQVRMLWNRLDIWYDAAISGGISTDLLPFTLSLLAAAWLLGYISSWFIFRSNNVWIGVMLMGTAILTNLSFLPERFAANFFVFAFLAILLVVRLSIVQRHQVWTKAGIEFSPVSSWLTLNSAVWFSFVVLIVAALLPMNVVVSPTLAKIWRTARSPVENLEGEFARLFSAIPSRKDLPGRLFGKTLPFTGKISFGGEAVFWADTDYPSYWLSQTYSEYTSQGWIAGETQSIDAGPEVVPPPRADSLKRVPVTQSLQLSFDTSAFLSGGSLDWISRDAVIESLAPKEFTFNLLDFSQNPALPEDVQKLAVLLRDNIDSRANDDFVESFISRNLPSDLVLIEVSYKPATDEVGQLLETVTLARKEPVTPEIVSWRFAKPFQANETYAMVSFVSLATDDELREAGTDYNSFITDHYLQLPASLPQRVRDLAENLTQGAANPLDKTLAIQRYLRGSTFVYSQDISAPPIGADGVDYFLFETKTGYSDYFGSSMTVMLRAVGVPARMAAGYAPGEYDSEADVRVIRDSDSHGWVQGYFPGYGWIDFEPTPRWPEQERKLLTGPGSDLVLNRRTGDDSIDEALDDVIEDLLDDPGPTIVGDSGFSFSFDVVKLLIRAGIVLGVVVFLWLIFQVIWTRGLGNATPVERAYTKMSRLGAWAGIKRGINQTPVEYALALSNALPTIATETQHVAWAYAGSRYGNREISEEESEELDQVWKSMRGSLFAKMLGRLLPMRRRQRR